VKSGTAAVLVCGGAGYIGSHMCKRLAAQGIEPICFDNLSTGHRTAVQWGPLVVGDLCDEDALHDVFARYRITAVMHFAARSLVAESIRLPEEYIRNNVGGTRSLLRAMDAAGVRRLVFSSTAAVYGNPASTPVDESHPTVPINPYGASKLDAEHLIARSCREHGLQAICLRYFNAAGADPDGEIGEAHEPETHLIPNLVRAGLDPQRRPAVLYGHDYPTPDGTCIRDFVHVEDLCAAHLAALQVMHPGFDFRAVNVGTGHGYSLEDVVSRCRAQLGGLPEIEYAGRRDGDPAVLVASNELARSLLGWQPSRTLDECIRDAIHWERKRAGVI
jgi:UDP-glucose 4-epimerase